MSIRSRILLAIATICCAMVFFLPVWSYSFYAPQYPYGLGMHIYIDDLKGHDKHDIQNINVLNNYVGMKPIEKDMFPEFDIAPWLFGILLILAVLAFVTGKRALLILWLVYFVLLTIVGMVDMYMWAYDFGHDINPRAAIKVPGQNYQPPLIGSATLLTITVHSWPASGGYFLLAGKLIGILVLMMEYNLFNKWLKK